jgi:methylthioribose-1-phosphate isomerase
MVWDGFTQRTVSWEDGAIVLIDQRKLPNRLIFIKCSNHDQVVDAIKNMRIRGAPAIGAIAGMALALTAHKSKAKTKEELIKELESTAKDLRATRPTGVNLFWAIQRVMNRAHSTEGRVEDMVEAIKREALLIAEEDVEINRAIGKNGAKILEDGDTVLTHCKWSGFR